MPRYARDVSKTGIYHVMIRGINKMDIFLNEEDKNRFIETLVRMKEAGEYILYGYCLMNNHAHLLIKEHKDPIKRTMKRISVSYSYYFNQKYKRVGHLFQDRYKSEKVETDEYLMACLRYIHNNPLKAGIVSNLKDYQWSSYRIYILKGKDNFDIIEKEYILEMFSQNPHRAIELFEKYSKQEDRNIFMDYEESKNGSIALGNEDAIKEVLKKYNTDIEKIKAIKDKVKRDTILRELKKVSGNSIRDLSKIIGISKDIIARA